MLLWREKISLYDPSVQDSYSALIKPFRANGTVKLLPGRWNGQWRENSMFDITIVIASSGEGRQTDNHLPISLLDARVNLVIGESERRHLRGLMDNAYDLFRCSRNLNFQNRTITEVRYEGPHLFWDLWIGANCVEERSYEKCRLITTANNIIVESNM